jgi:AcrR family transcriptional regulator
VPVLEAARPGRPRDPELDDRIRTAALELLAADGYDALTVEAVAARAGVGKATVYRRWSGKEDLVVDALASLSEQPEPVRDASVRDELVSLLEAARRKSRRTLAGQIFPQVLAQPALLARYREQVLDPRRQRYVAVLQRGVDEGLLRPDADLELAVDLLVGPMAYRNLIRTDPPPGPDLAARVVDAVLKGLS